MGIVTLDKRSVSFMYRAMILFLHSYSYIFKIWHTTYERALIEIRINVFNPSILDYYIFLPFNFIDCDKK